MHFIDVSKGVGLTAIAFNGGQPKGGVEQGPQAMLDNGLISGIEKFTAFKQVHYDAGKPNTFEHTMTRDNVNDTPHGIMKKPRFCGRANEEIAELVYKQASMGRFALNVGGDHSIALGTITGVSRAVRERLNKDTAVIWIDAHADVNTPETTDTGNVHGMPVAFLLNLVSESTKIPGFEWIKSAALKPNKLVYIGLRDVDYGEREILKKHGIKAFSMHEVDKYGIAECVEQAIKHVSPNGECPVHLSYDIDALDPEYTPSTGTPVKGGLTYREGRYIAERLHQSGLLVSMDLVEVNPSLGEDPKSTIAAGCNIIRSALGESLL